MTNDTFVASIGRGSTLRCKGWRQEGILRMLENTVANGEYPEKLIIYGGSGKAARNWEAYHGIVAALRNLADDETLVIQSGKPVAVFGTSSHAPRVLCANTNLVGKWATWPVFRELEKNGLMMYAQYTAGNWAYIGTQGILQGTYETFAACGALLPSGSLAGHIVLTAGLGGMGGAQPLAVKMAGGICIAVEIDPLRAERRKNLGYCDVIVDNPKDALLRAQAAAQSYETLGIALIGNAVETFEELHKLGLKPVAVTDQTSAHDPLNGFIPCGYSLSQASELRVKYPDSYIEQSLQSMARHVRTLLDFKANGAITFEYGNNLRGHARDAGEERAFEIPGFVPLFVRSSFCRGRGPFRWVCLSGALEDLAVTDASVLATFPNDKLLHKWITTAQSKVPLQGLPARSCWLGLGERDRFGKIMNQLVREGRLKGPIAISRDHLDSGSVAQPTRETEGMRDGSDAVADWPLLNALLNAANGADLVTIHQGAGSGMGGSISDGMIIIADGTDEAEDRIGRCLISDPGIGVIRHADAGYEEAQTTAKLMNLHLP